MSVAILTGDCRDVLALLPEASVQCCVTSPPYFGHRDYGHDGQIGLEQTPDAYVSELVAVFREVQRTLRDDGVAFVSMGDSYAGGGRAVRAGSVLLCDNRRSWLLASRAGTSPKGWRSRLANPSALYGRR